MKIIHVLSVVSVFCPQISLQSSKKIVNNVSLTSTVKQVLFEVSNSSPYVALDKMIILIKNLENFPKTNEGGRGIW